MSNSEHIELTDHNQAYDLNAPYTQPLPPSPAVHASRPASPPAFAVRPAWRRTIYLLLEVPTSSPAAFLMHVFITALIVFSALVTVLETVPAFHSVGPAVWFGLESALVALFTAEYVARCVAHSTTWRGLMKWLFSFFAILDALAVFPYYIEIALQQDTSILFRFSILRMFRLLRVFKPFRYNSVVLLTIEVMYLSVRRSQHALLAIAFFVVMVLTVFSTLLYFAERGVWDPILETFVNTDGDPSQFASIPAAAWFVIVTITTVGYGEITPRSFLGRLVTLPLLVFGLLLIALPSFVLGREFSLVWERMAGREGFLNGREGFGEGRDGVSGLCFCSSVRLYHVFPRLTTIPFRLPNIPSTDHPICDSHPLSDYDHLSTPSHPLDCPIPSTVPSPLLSSISSYLYILTSHLTSFVLSSTTPTSTNPAPPSPTSTTTRTTITAPTTTTIRSTRPQSPCSGIRLPGGETRLGDVGMII
ncbi:hypothetical protein BD626DRAFT_464267 [Schizophyllum amplum]|uniref:Ion transport domain-containing protein n=1 Tax=Schizophyllum amplum TaxID=97359 RepID=A0A550BZG3_9AGAR|nr:hypothetical protein BD626DRAFT_464267 [Auriculariopsis ampla]